MASNTRSIKFCDYLPGVFQANNVILQLTVQYVSGTTVTVKPFSTGTVEFPAGTPVTVVKKGLQTVLKKAIPANCTEQTLIEVQDALFGMALMEGDVLKIASFLNRFLNAFETLFEEMEAEIEGTPERTSGGIPDLFDPATTPPQQFTHRPQPEFDYLNYLASWIALPLRTELIRREGENKPDYNARIVQWNREFFKNAILLYPQRGTLPGLDALLRAWLKGDLWETDPPLLILSDLTRVFNDVETIFQLAPEEDIERKPGEIYAQLGMNTVLGEGPPFFFIVDLITDPTVLDLRNPVGLDVFQRAVRFLLDAEKPAYTYYQLRVRAHTMQLAEEGQTTIDEWPGAQIGVTTLLWDEPWVFDSDC